MSQTPTLEQQLDLLIKDFALDVKTLLARIGNLAALTTTDKTSVVNAVNELQARITALAAASGAVINDAAGNGDTTVTWSADKIFDMLEAYKTALKNEILGGVGPAFDTLLELANSATGQESAITNLVTAVGETVRFTAQPLSATQRDQVRTNIAAASQAELDALEAAIGDPSVDLRALYRAARDAA